MADAAPTDQPDAQAVAPRQAPAPGDLGQTHLAKAFATLCSDQFIYVHGLGWHAWDGARWALDVGEAEARQSLLYVLGVAHHSAVLGDPQLAASLRACYSNSSQQGALAIAGVLPEFSTRMEELDTDPYLINCANGTLDLRTYELRPHDPKDLLTKIARAAYDPDAKSPVLDAFLAHTLPDEAVRSYLQRIMGLALFGGRREDILPIATGPSGTGKGTFYKAALFALEDYGHMAEQELFIATRSTNGAEGAKPAQLALKGKRFVVCSETDEGAKLNAALMKNLTGGDKITARAVYGKTAVTFDPSHTAFVATNFLPKVSADDDAIWRRIRVIPFEVKVLPEEKDAQLDEKLQLGADAFLAWAVQGWRDYVDAGNQMLEPKAVLARTSDYKDQSDSVVLFLKERTIEEVGARATRQEISRAYDEFCLSEQHTKVGRAELYKKIIALGYEDSKYGGTRVFKGLKLESTVDDEPINEEGMEEL